MKILTIRQVTERTSLSRSTIYRRALSDPTFPAVITLSAGRTGVEEEALEAWMTDAKRRAEVRRADRQGRMRAFVEQQGPARR